MQMNYQTRFPVQKSLFLLAYLGWGLETAIASRISIPHGNSTQIQCPSDLPKLKINSAKYRPLAHNRERRNSPEFQLFQTPKQPTDSGQCMDRNIGRLLDQYCHKKAQKTSDQPMACSLEVNDNATGRPCFKGPAKLVIHYTCQKSEAAVHTLNIPADQGCSFLALSLYCE